MPLAKEMGIDLKQFNLLEFEEGWDEYHIEATPTIVRFKMEKKSHALKDIMKKTYFENGLNKQNKSLRCEGFLHHPRMSRFHIYAHIMIFFM